MDEKVGVMWEETFYKVKYRHRMTNEEHEVLISASHPVERVREILTEVHANWEILDIIPKRKPA